MIDVSIIIPTYNRLWCLPEAVESCRNNKCNVEIIVVDDGSTDGTMEWLITQKDVIAFQQAHQGKCQAVNKGFQMAGGKYIRFLDSDDILAPFANDEEFELAEIENADMVVSGYQLFADRDTVIKKQNWILTDDFIAQQLGECDSSHYSAYLFKKTFINDIAHRPEFALRDDRLFVLEAALKQPQLAIHNGMALLHRVAHHDRLQITNGAKHIEQNQQHADLYKLILIKLKEQGRLTQRHMEASINILWPLAHWIAKYDLKEAVKLVDWLRDFSPNFDVPQQGALGWMYKFFGFKNTEKLLNFRRKIIRW